MEVYFISVNIMRIKRFTIQIFKMSDPKKQGMPMNKRQVFDFLPDPYMLYLSSKDTLQEFQQWRGCFNPDSTNGGDASTRILRNFDNFP